MSVYIFIGLINLIITFGGINYLVKIKENKISKNAPLPKKVRYYSSYWTVALISYSALLATGVSIFSLLD